MRILQKEYKESVREDLQHAQGRGERERERETEKMKSIRFKGARASCVSLNGRSRAPKFTAGLAAGLSRDGCVRS